jgi:DNA-binding response OmpR family regulator
LEGVEMKVLLVEDDKKIAGFIKNGLNELDYRVDIASDGEEGVYLAQTNDYDIMIVDWMLPKKSGIDVIKEIKKTKNTPALILTAKRDLEDKIEGLNVADDYLTKPFEFAELIARLKALYRRSHNINDNILRVKNIELNPDTKEVKKDEKRVDLTAKEFELLKYLMINKNKVVTTDMINNNLWENGEEIKSNVVNVYLSNLRKKLGKDLIQTRRGMGFVLVDE